jgi:SAM-dependent methyltransferase
VKNVKFICRWSAKNLKAAKAEYLFIMTQHLTNVFNNAYTNRIWGGNGNGSGDGSEPTANANLMTTLIHIIKRYNIRRLCDAPCGAGKWMDAFLEELKHREIRIEYVGLDIADEAVSSAQQLLDKHNDFHSVTIQQADIGECQLPSSFDLILCRDALQHLSYMNIYKVIHNIAHAGSKWVIFGGYWPGDNHNIPDGNYFAFNITQPPFSLAPFKVYSEEHDDKEERKHLFLFDRPNLDKIDWFRLKKDISSAIALL